MDSLLLPGLKMENHLLCVGVDNNAGIKRREVFTDAKSVTHRTLDDGILTEEEYIALLSQKGVETLSECQTETSFNGEADASGLYKYPEDFQLGDIVQILDRRTGREARTRILEIVYSDSSEGFKMYPTFSEPLT